MYCLLIQSSCIVKQYFKGTVVYPFKGFMHTFQFHTFHTIHHPLLSIIFALPPATHTTWLPSSLSCVLIFTEDWFSVSVAFGQLPLPYHVSLHTACERFYCVCPSHSSFTQHDIPDSSTIHIRGNLHDFVFCYSWEYVPYTLVYMYHSLYLQ